VFFPAAYQIFQLGFNSDKPDFFVFNIATKAWYTLTGDKVEFNMVDFVESRLLPVSANCCGVTKTNREFFIPPCI